MKVRDAHAILNGSTEVFEAESGAIQVLGDDNQPLYRINVNGDGSLFIMAESIARHGGETLDNVIHVVPSATNAIFVKRLPYVEVTK